MSLSGAIPERNLLRLAQDLKDDIESLPGVLEVDIGGDREEVKNKHKSNGIDTVNINGWLC